MCNLDSKFFACLLVASSFSFATRSPVVPPQVDGCYQISTAQELYGFAEIVSGKYVETPTSLEDGIYEYVRDSAACGVLTADIALDTNEYGAWKSMQEFAGVFDGQGHTISNLQNLPFFGSIEGTKDKPAVVKNVGWTNASFKVNRANFGLINRTSGYVELDHVFSTIDYSATEGNVSCFVLSQNGHLTISNSYNTGALKYDHYDKERIGIFVAGAGGVVSLKNVYNLGGSAAFVGYAHDTLSVLNSFTMGPGKWRPLVQRTITEGKSAVVNESNFFYPTTIGYYGGNTEDEFANGSIAMKLHYLNDEGEIWGQTVGVDSVPNFSGKVIGATNTDIKVSNIKVVSFDGDTTWYPKYYVEGVEKPFTYEPMQRDGFIFTGWFDNPDGAGREPITKISSSATGNLTVYGKWWAIPKRKGKGECYEIGSMEDLFGFAAIVNGAPGVEKDSLACAKLVADIKFVNKKEGGQNLWWLPIQNFAGSFDGNGYSISGLTARHNEYYEKDSKPMGLFGSISGGSDEKPVVIKNFRVFDCSFVSSWGAGGAVGRVKNGSHAVLDSIVIESDVFGELLIGGIIGSVDDSAKVTLSHSAKKNGISGDYNIGGLIGNISNKSQVTISKSFVEGDVTAYENGVGSIVGVISKSDVVISEVYANSKVSGYSYVGGIVGDNLGNLQIENTYLVGDVVGLSYSCPAGAGAFAGVILGGFVANGGNLFLVNSYHLGDVSSGCPDKRVDAVAAHALPENLHIDNAYYLSTTATEFVASAADSAMFANGFVAYALHNYDNGKVNGDIWGQKIGSDPYPVFTSKVDGYEVSHKYSKLVLHTYEGDTLKYANAYMEGIETPLPLPYREGHIFHGWFANPEFAGDTIRYINSSATGEQHFYANFEIMKFEISANIYDSGCRNSTVEGVGVYDYGAKVVLKAVLDTGCQLRSYNPHFNEDGIYVIDKVTESKSVLIYLENTVYMVTYYINGEEWIDYSGRYGSKYRQYVYGDSLEYAEPWYKCYDFKGWYDNEKLEGTPVTGIKKGEYGNRDVWAKFEWNSECPENYKSSSSIASSSSVLSSSSSANSSSSSVILSSSSVVKSSSSVKSCSSVTNSSSSSAKSSSSSVQKSSSSSKTNSIVQVFDVNMNVNVAGRFIQIDGAQVGAKFALFDMQGKVLLSGFVETGSRQIAVQRVGAYLLYVGTRMQKVIVK